MARSLLPGACLRSHPFCHYTRVQTAYRTVVRPFLFVGARAAVEASAPSRVFVRARLRNFVVVITFYREVAHDYALVDCITIAGKFS
jgi:hypothetical protein